MTREARLRRALLLLILAMTMQPLFVLGCNALPADGVVSTSRTVIVSTSDLTDDDALDIVFGGDPGVISGIVALPNLEPAADVAALAPAHVPPRVADPADHPPRLA